MIKVSVHVHVEYTCADPLLTLIRAEAESVEEELEADYLEAEMESRWFAGTFKQSQFQSKE